MNLSTALVALVFTATPGVADIAISFTESAPKDRFTVENTGTCALEGVEITFNLAASAGNLIFDIAAGGPGVEVFQPIEFVENTGQTTMELDMSADYQTATLSAVSLAPGARIAFTTDLDDQLAQSALGQIRVVGSEIAGARVSVISSGGRDEGVFDAKAKARLSQIDCLS